MTQRGGGRAGLATAYPIKPLLRWAGGKQQLVGALLSHAPEDASSRRYFEPFLGAASLYLALRPRRAFLSDSNPLLIDFYERVRDSPRQVSRYLSQLAKLNNCENYYAIREDFNSSRMSIKKAAQFLYLNRTSFNGVYRVNKSGDYNVPFGLKPRPWFPSTGEIVELSSLLAVANLKCVSFEVAIKRVKKGDFIYLDPPYAPLSKTAYFAHYTVDRFGTADQFELASIMRTLNEKGALVMMSNSDTPEIRSLYADFNISSIDVRRYVTCKQRHAVQELIIRNY